METEKPKIPPLFERKVERSAAADAYSVPPTTSSDAFNSSRGGNSGVDFKFSTVESTSTSVRGGVSGEEFFRFFSMKRLKLGVAFLSGAVGVLGNFYAVRHQITQTRFDMTGNQDMADLYAFGLTVLLDLMIVFFHLMRIPVLTIASTVVAVVVSLYANISLIVQGHDIATIKAVGGADVSYSGSIVVGIMISTLPVFILTYLMHLVMAQFETEMRLHYGNSKTGFTPVK